MKLFIKILVWIIMIPILVVCFIPMLIYNFIKNINEACDSLDDDDDLTYMMMYHYYRNKHNNE